jgi:hypothetical protein
MVFGGRSVPRAKCAADGEAAQGLSGQKLGSHAKQPSLRANGLCGAFVLNECQPLIFQTAVIPGWSKRVGASRGPIGIAPE